MHFLIRLRQREKIIWFSFFPNSRLKDLGKIDNVWTVWENKYIIKLVLSNCHFIHFILFILHYDKEEIINPILCTEKQTLEA